MKGVLTSRFLSVFFESEPSPRFLSQLRWATRPPRTCRPLRLRALGDAVGRLKGRGGSPNGCEFEWVQKVKQPVDIIWVCPFSPTAESFGAHIGCGSRAALREGSTTVPRGFHQGSTKIRAGFHEVLRELRGGASKWKPKGDPCHSVHLSTVALAFGMTQNGPTMVPKSLFSRQDLARCVVDPDALTCLWDIHPTRAPHAVGDMT